MKRSFFHHWGGGLIAAVFLLTMGLFAGPVEAQVTRVSDIVVEGNQRIEAETVRSYMVIRQGDIYSGDLVDQSLKALFATGLFADVRIRRDRDVLTVEVVENPIINQVLFEGNQKFDAEKLGEEVRLASRVVYTRARVQADAQRIVELYRRSGRFAATVEPQIVRLSQNRVDLVFEINEGPVTGIRRINFIGNETFTDADLRGVVLTEESRWWKVLAQNDNYDPDRLAFDRELLRRHYLAQGYADFRVVSAVAELTRDREDFFLTFVIEEGERYRIGEVDIQSEIKSLAPANLWEYVRTDTGEIYNADDIDKSIEKMTEHAGTLGYAFVDIRPRVRRNREERTVDIDYKIFEGPRVYVERINIAGNTSTLERVIRREFRLAEGDAFNSVLLDRSKARIRALGFFGDVQVTEEEGSTEDRTVINVEVEEQSTGELSIGAGFSSVQSFVGELKITERNLLGRGQRLNFSVQAGSRRQEVDISFTEPYFLGRELAAGVDIFQVSSDFQDEAAFDSVTSGFGLRFGFPITEFLSMNTRYILREDTIENVGRNAAASILAAVGSETTSGIGYTLVFDNRNDPRWPTKGQRWTFKQDFAGLGGTLNYLRSEMEHATYYALYEDIVIGVLRFNAGYVNGLGDDVRINERFFLNQDDLRGFDRAGLGPRDSRTLDGLGGNLYYTISGESFFPLGLPEEFGVKGSAFIDMGSLAEVDGPGTGIRDTGTIRVSIGVGVSWESPFGPIRIDLAEPLVKEDFDEIETLRFSFGTRL